jgi:hypothetical protein
MKLILCFLMTLATLSLSGCATTYQKSGLTGGFRQTNIEGDIWRIEFGGNGYATYETVQTYWLYRCAELSLEKGFDGFEILSDISLTMTFPAEQLSDAPRTEKVQMIYIPMDMGPKPSIEADVQFLHGPIQAAPPRRFDARQLKATLEPLITGKKCSMGNICPHAHKYIYGERLIDQS